MLLLLLLLVAALVAAGVIALYVAYPHRGEEMPVAPRVGTAMKQAADAIPVLEDDEVQAARRS
ncbi:hypothetical protein D9V37_04475 [Nocardioides mangrovicus]|uniref:Uncharacterized protein n=1 Tax=Nocardioides mangrovicus TaxID=2478913 RepID=A0A3L8P862_9ACTN|nr:hypothetical protein [Nocardioides mangrovicus]RLV51172.1 hypothetical protein D9V37_04475 [Nocardioides mangrovicus]